MAKCNVQISGAALLFDIAIFGRDSGKIHIIFLYFSQWQ